MQTIVTNPSITSRNLLKNPNFQIIQGTASGTLANSTALPTASLGYPGETEWCIAASGGTPAYAFSQTNESVTFTGAVSTTAIYLLQRLESKDTNCLKNKTVTLSAEISNSLLTTVTWEVFRPATSDDTHGTIASATQTLVSSGTWTVNSTLTRYRATITLPPEASKGLEVRLRVGAQTSGTWVVSQLQLEEGNIATVFNCGNYSEELIRCRRYAEVLSGEEIAFNGYAKVSSFAAFVYKFPVSKFAIPVFVDLGSNYVIQYQNTVVAVSSFGVASNSKESIVVDVGSSAVLTAGDGVIVRHGSTSTSILGFLAHIP